MHILVVTLLFASAVIHFGLAVYAFVRRNLPPARPLFALALACFVIAFTYAMDLTFSSLEAKVIWMQIRISFSTVLSLATLLFVYAYVGKPSQLRPWILALLFLYPILNLAVIWTSPYHQLMRYDFVIDRIGDLELLKWKNGPLYWLAVLYIQTLFGVSLYQLARSIQNASYGMRRRTVFIFVALSLPLITDLLFNLGYSPVPGINFIPFTLLITMGILFYALFWFHWQNIVPLARSRLVDMMPAGIILLDRQNQVLDINPAARDQLGLREGVIGQSLEAVLPHLEVEVREHLQLIPGRYEIHTTKENGQSAYYEMELTSLQGKIKRFDGKVIVIQDVTERKNNELRLLQLTQGIEQSPTSVVITDLYGHIEYVNPNFAELTGYDPSEAIGKNANLVSSGLTPDEIYQDMWQTITSGETWHGEFLNKKKNGELYWEKAVIAPIKDKQGTTFNYIAIKEDITVQKTAEEALRRSEAELRLVNTELEQRLAKIEILEKELREQAIRDPLTGLFNRRYLNESIEREIARSERAGEPLSVILIDVDHFKHINDTYGHQAGDAFLIILANRLQNRARRSDIICRYGGEEFLLVLPNISVDAAARRADELRQSILGTSMSHQSVEIKTTISAGVASFPEDGLTAVALLKAADEALYISKNLGRNLVTVWGNQQANHLE